MRNLQLLVVGLFAITACNAAGSGGDDDPTPDGGVDPGPGCSMTSPRSVAPETFVGPTGLQPRLTSLIDGAQTSLDVFMYLWTVRPLAERVIAAKQRGVAVRVILDPEHEGNGTVRSMLMAAGVPVRNAITLYTFSHAKFMLIDGKAATIMSMNFNVDAMDRERNYGMVDRDPLDVEDVQAIFDQDWASAGGEPPKPADLACTRLVVSPTNARTRILAHIDSAEETLELQVMYMAETSVREAVLAAKARGVVVRVILGERTDEAVPMLKAAGIALKTSNTYYLHSKLIVADGVPFVGSENMSFTSLTKNREVGALVFEPAAAAVVTQQFEADWTAGSAI